MPQDLISEITILEAKDKLCVGLNITHSLTESKAKELWSRFMPRKSEIKNKVSNDLLSIQVYQDNSYFNKFDPSNNFETWASIEVSSAHEIPEGMKQIKVPKGTYANFIHRGAVDTFGAVFQYFYSDWLAQSGYELDNTRPHFEVLGKAFLGPHNPDSEEEIWIPIKSKGAL